MEQGTTFRFTLPLPERQHWSDGVLRGKQAVPH
jgi:hypothetical protein